MHNLPKSLPSCKQIDHKIEIVLRSGPPSKAHYMLNQKELEELKTQINDLLSHGYIKYNKLLYGTHVLFMY
jgi:hypothetical protein